MRYNLDHFVAFLSSLSRFCGIDVKRQSQFFAVLYLPGVAPMRRRKTLRFELLEDRALLAADIDLNNGVHEFEGTDVAAYHGDWF